MKAVITKHKYFLAFTFLYFILGLFSYKDFGATYDEKTEYDAGKYLVTYYKTPTTSSYLIDLSTFNPNRVHHDQLPIFSDYSRVYPMLVSLLNPNFYLEWFHFQNIIFGYFIFLFSYALYYLVYKKSAISVLGPIFLFLTPVITGHIPANPKDIPFSTVMLLGVLGIYFFSSYVPKKKLSNNFYLLSEIIFLGIVFGIAQSLRVVGLTLFATYFIYGLFLSRSMKDVAFIFLKIIATGFISLLIWAISVPFVGVNVITNVVSVFSNAVDFQLWDYEVLYFGEFLYKQDRPWHYLFVYLLIQLPLFTLFGLFLGIGTSFAKKVKYSKNHPVFLTTILIALNILLYFVFKPVIYNGIRHFLYLVVFLTILAGFALIDLYQVLKTRNKFLLKVLTASYCLFTLIRMVHLHPYEYVYFNELIGGLSGAEGQFELDYWGAAYKEATEFVAEQAGLHKLENLIVSACDEHFAVDYFAQHRFKRINASKDSDVIICDTFKVRLRAATGQRSFTETHPLVKTIERENVSIHNIYARPEFIQYFE